MRRPDVRARTVLVTGCSSGIGRATAILLRQSGWRTLATARSDADLEVLKADGFTALELDLADPVSVERCAATTLELCEEGLGGLVNNAGYAQPGAIEDVGRDALRRQLEVNVDRGKGDKIDDW